MEKIEFNSNSIENLEQRYRALFINSLGGFKSLCLIGTRSKKGQNNLSIFNSFFHIGAHPPLFGFIFRPDIVERHTLNNILETGVFSVNHVKQEFYKSAHQTAARYPRDISEFEATGLTKEYIEEFYAPFVKESAIKIGAQLRQKINLEINGTILIIAEIIYVSVPKDCIANDGFVDLEKANTITCSGLDSYHNTTKISRLSYPMPSKDVEILNI